MGKIDKSEPATALNSYQISSGWTLGGHFSTALAGVETNAGAAVFRKFASSANERSANAVIASGLHIPRREK